MKLLMKNYNSDMPTYTIANNNDDGKVKKGAGTSGSVGANFATIRATTLGDTRGGWLRFTGITIPQFATIDTASLNFYAARDSGAPSTILIEADNRLSPPNPYTSPGAPTEVISGTNRVATASSPVITGTVASVLTPQPTEFNLVNANTGIKSIVQSLVNSHDYSNGTMVFYLNNQTAPYAGFRFVYNRDWGTSKDAELVVTFTASDNSSSSSSSVSSSSSSSESSPPILQPKSTFRFT